MSPEVEAALFKIGLEDARRRARMYVAVLEGEISGPSTFHINGHKHRKEVDGWLEGGQSILVQLLTYLDHLPEEVRSSYNMGMTSSEDRSRPIPDHTREIETALSYLNSQIDQHREWVRLQVTKNKIEGKRDRRPKLEQRLRVAEAMGEIYYLATGKIPTSGHNDEKPNGEFGPVLAEVLQLLDLRPENITSRPVSKHAKEHVERKRALLDKVRDVRWRQHVFQRSKSQPQ